MKRFLRYVLYREGYRWLRNVGKDDESSSSPSTHSTDDSSPHQASENIPLEDGPIESTDELQAVLQQMDPYEFEYFIADLWEQQGWQTEVSSAAADEGVDVIARKEAPYEQTLLIQAKRYGPNTTVGSPDIQQYASLRHQYDGVDKVLVVTTNEFTGQAQKLAGQLNVKLIDGEDLSGLIAQQEALGLVAEYLDFVTTAETDTETSDTTAEEYATGTQSTGTSTDQGTTASGSSTSSHTEPLPSTIWEKAITVALPGWFIAFFSVTVLPEALWGVLFFTVWLGLPVAIFLDSRQVREHSDWPTHTWAYVVTSFVWLFAVIPAGLYLWRRRSVETTPGDDSVNPRNSDTANTQDTTDSTDASSMPNSESPANAASSNTSSEHSQSTQDTNTVSTSGRVNDRIDIEYEGDRYYAQSAASPDGTYTAAYQDGRSGQGDPQRGRVFLFEDEDLCFTTKIARPNACGVANNGTVAVVDWNLDWGEELSGTFHVFNRAGQRLVKHEFDANLGPTAISPDGTYAATSTLNPDCSTYVFDIEAGELLLKHENQHGNVQHLEFVEHAGNQMLRLGEPDSDSAYGIDFGGHIIWKSDGLKRQNQLNRLLESSEEADLREAIDLLNDGFELATEDYEQRNVAQRLADAHWKLARSIEQEAGVTDEWWTHLDKAAQYYTQVLPRYAGKQGVAKVKRKQGKQHLDNGDKEAAQRCFKEIADLEDEYDVQLLTNADERRLNELHSSS